MNKNTLTLLALTLGATSLCRAADATESQAAQQKPAFDLCQSITDRLDIFNAERDGAENPWIQDFRVKFRAQYQYGYVDPAGGADREKGGREHGRNTNSEWRRFRIAAQAKVLNRFTLVSNWNIGGLEGRDEFKNGKWNQTRTSSSVDELYISGKIAKPVSFTLGKHKPAFMGEYRTSSAKIVTIERSLLVNQLKSEKNYGISFKNADKKATWGWEAGLWVNGARDNQWAEPAFDSDTGYMFGGGISYATGDNSRLYLDYMHSFADWSDVNRTDLSYEGCGARDIVALTWEAKQDKLSFTAEAIAAFNLNSEQAENAYGIVLMPTYRISPHFEGVFRYQLAAGSNAIAGDGHFYTKNSTYNGAADLVQGLYFGMNYYVCPKNPDGMKLMLGAEYLNSHGTDAAGNKGFTGWGITGAMRVNF